jgi:hypothetical protein
MLYRDTLETSIYVRTRITYLGRLEIDAFVVGRGGSWILDPGYIYPGHIKARKLEGERGCKTAVKSLEMFWD